MPNVPDPTADACDREAAWLEQVDSLATLLKPVGPWDVVQAYWPGNRFAGQKAGIYVCRGVLDDDHPLSQRYRPQYVFHVKLVWPVKNPNGAIAESEQRNFDVAVGYALQRIRGPLGDKTHGGRFLSVAETPEGASVNVTWEDPEVTIPAHGWLRALATYHADDIEFNG